MARYRKIEIAVWHDERFRALSSAPANGQTLWLYLLCGPRTTIFPGLVVARQEVIASDLGWPLEAFREAYGEAFREGLVEADWKAGVVVLRKALLDSHGDPRDTARPESPNVLKSWAKSWGDIPECELKRSYLRSLESFAEGLGKGFTKAFTEGFRKALGKPSLHPSSNQEQDQEQDQDSNKSAPACARDPEPQVTLHAPRRHQPASTEVARRLVGDAWQYAGQSYTKLGLEGVDPTAPNCWSGLPPADSDPMQELRARIDELLRGQAPSFDLAREVIRRRIDVAAAEARRDGRRDYMTPARLWAAKSFAIASAMSPEQVANRQRAGPLRKPNRDTRDVSDVSVGRIEPKTPDQYPDGEVDL
ncbi:MAG: hypothetical protein ACTHU0_19300 [Kofleriaceae bacterium]